MTGTEPGELGASSGEARAPEVGEAPSLPRRLVDVIFSPGRLFSALADEPRWGWILLLGAVVSAAATAVVPTEIWVETIEEAMRGSGQPVPEGFDAENFGELQKAFGLVWAAVAWYVSAFLLAGVLTFLFAFILGDRGRYRQYLSVCAHALWVMAVAAVLLTPLRIVQGDLSVTLHVGLFVPLDEGWIAGFLGQLDLFWLWAMVLVGIGAHEIDRRRSVGSAVALTLCIPLALAALIATIGV